MDIFLTAYIDNILVFSKMLQEHRKHVKTFLARLQATGLQLDIEKCQFEVHETKYFRLIIQSAFSNDCPRCIKMDLVRTHAIDTWESPRSVKDVQGFLGIANFY